MGTGRGGPRPPGPPGRRAVGNLADFEADRLGFLVTSRDVYGGVVSFDRRTTIVNDPRLARGVLLDRSQDFTVRDNFLQRPMSPADITRGWAMRRQVNRFLRPQAVRAMSGLVADAAQNTFAAVEQGLAVDPVPLLERVTGPALAEYYFGRDGQHVPQAVGALLDALARIVGNPFALPPNRFSPARRRVERRRVRLLTIVCPLVHDRMERPWAHADFVTRVAGMPGVSTARLTHWILASLLAGHRVPAAAAAWVLMTVGERPALQAQLETEAAQFARDQSRDNVNPAGDYPLATAVVLETLRLYPTTWMMTRTAARRVVLDGYQFEPGHQFLISPYVLQRDPVEWPNPREFLTERWLEGRQPQGIFVPFGLGMHACPGRDIALRTLVATLLTVVKGWTISRAAGVVREDARTALVPKGLRLSFSARIPGDADVRALAG